MIFGIKHLRRGNMNNTEKSVKELKIFGVATDPVYVGTGGYTIGRVDNTIVRDPITKIPKIPGSTLAGTWRYYTALELQARWEELLKELADNNKFDDFKSQLQNLDGLDTENINLDDLDKSSLKNFILSLYDKLDLKLNKKNKDKLDEKLKLQKQVFEKLIDVLDDNNSNFKEWLKFKGNRYSSVFCAGQDELPQEEIVFAPFKEKENSRYGHCGHCIVCKVFGFSKKDRSWQGLSFFSDLNIIFFPVYTRLGVRWVTSHILLKQIGISESIEGEKIKTKEGNEQWLNLGWLNLEVGEKHNIKEKELPEEFKDFLKPENIIVVPDSLISQIINSNLEVRTSVSIDPITGTAKEGALFTSEAIPRGTVFYGEVRIFDKSSLIGDKVLPNYEQIKGALCDSKHFYETLGIGGMTTRGFGRLKIEIEEKEGGQQNGE